MPATLETVAASLKYIERRVDAILDHQEKTNGHIADLLTWQAVVKAGGQKPPQSGISVEKIIPLIIKTALAGAAVGAGWNLNAIIEAFK